MNKRDGRCPSMLHSSGTRDCSESMNRQPALPWPGPTAWTIPYRKERPRNIHKAGPKGLPLSCMPNPLRRSVRCFWVERTNDMRFSTGAESFDFFRGVHVCGWRSDNRQVYSLGHDEFPVRMILCRSDGVTDPGPCRQFQTRCRLSRVRRPSNSPCRTRPCESS